MMVQQIQACTTTARIWSYTRLLRWKSSRRCTKNTQKQYRIQRAWIPSVAAAERLAPSNTMFLDPALCHLKQWSQLQECGRDSKSSPDRTSSTPTRLYFNRLPHLRNRALNQICIIHYEPLPSDLRFQSSRYRTRKLVCRLTERSLLKDTHTSNSL